MGLLGIEHEAYRLVEQCLKRLRQIESHFGHGIVQCATDLEHLYRIYSIPTHDKHQWLLLQFIVLLMMGSPILAME